MGQIDQQVKTNRYTPHKDYRGTYGPRGDETGDSYGECRLTNGDRPMILLDTDDLEITVEVYHAPGSPRSEDSLRLTMQGWDLSMGSTCLSPEEATRVADSIGNAALRVASGLPLEGGKDAS